MRIQVLLSIATTLLLAGCNAVTTQKTINPSTATANVDFDEMDFSTDYSISDTEFGTKTTVEVTGNQRIIQTNALPNHPTGKFPNPGNPNTISAPDVRYSLPVHPKFSGESRWAREPGVALNGVKFEPETAERFICETGEVYRIEAFQELVDLGLDFNHAHVQPTGAYHYHGVPVELVKALDKGEDIVLVGFALDGFPIYYSQSGHYMPSFRLTESLRTGDACSYQNPKQGMDKNLQNSQPDGTFVSDWEYVDGLGQLDECNGTTINGEYAYFVTDNYPYMSRCLKGLFKEERPPGPPPGGRPPRGTHRHGPGHRH
jgi:hypothetical protein